MHVRWKWNGNYVVRSFDVIHVPFGQLSQVKNKSEEKRLKIINAVIIDLCRTFVYLFVCQTIKMSQMSCNVRSIKLGINKRMYLNKILTFYFVWQMLFSLIVSWQKSGLVFVVLLIKVFLIYLEEGIVVRI